MLEISCDEQYLEEALNDVFFADCLQLEFVLQAKDCRKIRCSPNPFCRVSGHFCPKSLRVFDK